MYYERTQTGPWEPNNAEQVLFNKSTYPIAKVPALFWNTFRKQAASVPVYDSTTHKLVGPQEIGEGTVGYVVELLTYEEIQARIDQTFREICSAVRYYVEAEIDPAGMVKFNDLAKTGHSRAAEVLAWADSVYMEAELRKAQLEAGIWPVEEGITDFSMFGEKPWTVAQVLMEV